MMIATLVTLLAEVESRDVTKIWLYICTMLTCSVVAVAFFVYRAYRLDQKLREREIELDEQRRNREFIEKQFNEGGPIA